MSHYTKEEQDLRSYGVREALYATRRRMEKRNLFCLLIAIFLPVLSVFAGYLWVSSAPEPQVSKVYVSYDPELMYRLLNDIQVISDTLASSAQSPPLAESNEVERAVVEKKVNEEKPEVDPWTQVRPCAPTVIKVLLYAGDLAGLDQFLRDNGQPDADTEQYRAYRRQYEVWQNLVLRQTDRMPMQGRFTTALWPSERISSLNEVPTGLEVEVYNRYGWIGMGTSDRGVALREPIYCLEDIIEEIEWTPTISLTHVATSVITYDKGMWGFVSTFHVGRELSQEEFNHLYIDVTRGVGGNNWSSIGFVGGGSSSHGNYDVTPDRELVWEDYDHKGRNFETTDSYTVATDIPLYHEIVVHTVYFYADGSKRDPKAQRFVLWEREPGYVLMLETNRSPEPVSDTSRYQGAWFSEHPEQASTQ